MATTALAPCSLSGRGGDASISRRAASRRHHRHLHRSRRRASLRLRGGGGGSDESASASSSFSSPRARTNQLSSDGTGTPSSASSPSSASTSTVNDDVNISTSMMNTSTTGDVAAGTTGSVFVNKPRLARGSRLPPARRQPLDEYLRLVEEPDGSWELQSATAVFRSTSTAAVTGGGGAGAGAGAGGGGGGGGGGGAGSDAAVEVTLAATVHVGDASYYAGLKEECDANYDCVLFELITSEENLRAGRAPRRPRRYDDECTLEGEEEGEETGEEGDGEEQEQYDDDDDDEEEEEEEEDFLPTLAVQLSPTPDARQLAEVHGLCAQLDALDLRSDGWFVADMPKAELIRLQEEAGERTRTRRASSSRSSSSSSDDDDDDPATARTGRSEGGGGVAASAAALPPAIEALVVTARGRAGGGPVRQMTRALCWLVPCPEAHLLLLDWVWGGGRPAPVLGAMLDSLAAGDLTAARRLAFAQMIVSSQAKGAVGGGSEVPVLVARRNEVAVDCLRKAIAAKEVNRIGLLYGGLHMPGLTKSVMNDLGLEPADLRWRAVWRVEAPSRSPFVRWLALPVLLAVDGTDWASTLSEAVEFAGDGALLSAAIATGLYVVRHGALYYTLGKWVLEWNRQLFDGSGESEGGFQA